MTLNRLYPHDTAETALTDDELDAAYNWSQGHRVALNIVTTLNGSLTDSEGTSNGLSNPEDRRILGRIRSSADVIVVGATTARKEQYTSPEHASLAIVTASGDLSGLAVSNWESTILLAPDGVVPSREARGATLITIPRKSDHLSMADGIVSRLHDHGFERILGEGGGKIAQSFGTSAALTDLFLSLSPRTIPSGTPWLNSAQTPGAQKTLDLGHMLRDTESGAIYTRWVAAS